MCSGSFPAMCDVRSVLILRLKYFAAWKSTVELSLHLTSTLVLVDLVDFLLLYQHFCFEGCSELVASFILFLPPTVS